MSHQNFTAIFTPAFQLGERHRVFSKLSSGLSNTASVSAARLSYNEKISTLKMLQKYKNSRDFKIRTGFVLNGTVISALDLALWQFQAAIKLENKLLLPSDSTVSSTPGLICFNFGSSFELPCMCIWVGAVL